MFETILGAEIPLPVRFFIAFLVVLALIGLTAWVVRRFGSDRLGNSARGRAPRLAVIDAANVDSRRRLIIIRRDNVEHLLMIGGPTDVVVETNIVRGATPATREPTLLRPASSDTLPRPVPLEEGAWQEPAVRPVPGHEERIEPPLRPTARPADALAGLSAELSARPVPAPEPPPRPRAAPPVEAPRPPASADKIGPMEKNLAEMTERLEASLRRPAPLPEAPPKVPEPAVARPAPPPPPPPVPERPVAPPPPPPVVERPVLPPTAEVKPPAPRPDAKPAAEPNPFESLEQEMASLLGRNQNKT